jgi:hypothetical protein
LLAQQCNIFVRFIAQAARALANADIHTHSLTSILTHAPMHAHIHTLLSNIYLHTSASSFLIRSFIFRHNFSMSRAVFSSHFCNTNTVFSTDKSIVSLCPSCHSFELGFEPLRDVCASIRFDYERTSAPNLEL